MLKIKFTNRYLFKTLHFNKNIPLYLLAYLPSIRTIFMPLPVFNEDALATYREYPEDRVCLLVV